MKPLLKMNKEKTLPYSRQLISSDDIKNVTKVLNSDYLTQGKNVSEFENKISKIVNSKYAVAANSATSSLHLACLALGMKKGDWLWTSPNSFIASANCGIYCGAKVDFIDIDLNTYNISFSKLEQKLKKSKKSKTLPKALVLVHFAGNPVDSLKIKNLSKKYKFKIIEDASHALGAKTKHNKVGDCKFSDITVFSFHPVKMITTAEGGIATTNDKYYADQMRMLRTHGINYNKDNKLKNFLEPWYFDQQDLGFNYRMNDVEAALGISQLRQLKRFVNERNKISKIYNKRLKNFPLILPKVEKKSICTFHLYVIRIDKKKTNKTQRDLYKHFLKSNIKVNVHYIPIYRHSFYKKMGFKNSNFPNTEEYYSSAISLPIFPGITKKDLNRVFNSLEDFFYE